MSRPVCHLVLELTPAEWGVLLSRVHHAERLEELGLTIDLVSVHSTCTLTCVLICYVSGNSLRMIFGCSYDRGDGCVYAGL